MKHFFLALCIFVVCGSASSQTYSLYFPHFGGTSYDFFLINGDRNDTIGCGTIPAGGRLTLHIPENHKGYVGMARWMLEGGGGLDFVVNGEDFSVSCTEEMPSDETIIYKGSPENDFLRGQHFRQQKLLQKVDGMQTLLSAYQGEPESQFYLLLQTEWDKLRSQFSELTDETRQSGLYAARYRRISDFYNWLPLYEISPNSGDNEETRLSDMRRFISEELDVDVLYTSGLYQAVISQAAGIYPDKADFGRAMAGLLERTRSPKVFELLATDLVSLTEQYDQKEAGEIIVSYLMASGRIERPNALLERAFATSRIRPGAKAPALSDGRKLKNTLLVFYETGCGPCENEMVQLRSNYRQIKENGYEVVSISADHDPDIFKNTSKLFPWPQKYCDGKGLGGEDFKNYGAVGTPTIFLIDSKGVVLGRYASFREAMNNVAPQG